MAQANVTVKIWKSENIVRDQEILPLQGETYDSVEALTGLDTVDQIDLSRPTRNIFEDQQKMFNFLGSLALSSKENAGVFKNSLEHQLDVAYTVGPNNPIDDFIPVTLSSVYEQWQYDITITTDLNDLQSQYITFGNPSASQYYIWYNVDGGGTDPAPGGAGVEVTVVTGETIENVAQNTVTAVGNASIPFSANNDGSTVKFLNEQDGDATDPASTYFSPTVTTQGSISIQQYYARIKPGIAFVDGTIVVAKPNTYLAERIIEKIYGLDTWEAGGGYCSILYDYTTDLFHMKIRILVNGSYIEHTFINGATEFGTFDAGYQSAANLFQALYTNAQIGYQFAYAVSASGGPDFTTIPLEPMAKLASGTNDLFWSIRYNGDLEYNATSIGASGIDLYEFNYTAAGGSVTINTATDTRPFYQNFNDFEGNIYLNVPDSWNTSDTKDTEPWDPADGSGVGEVSYDEVTNSTTLITIFRQHQSSGVFADNTFEAGSVVFGWVEGRIAVVDPHGVVPNDAAYENKFYLNKDLLVQWGDTGGEFGLFSDIANFTSSGFPVVELYSGLAGISPITDATVAFVQETNQFYRYSASAFGFIPVSDPHKQFWAQVARASGNGAITDFTFTGIVWRTDGSNIQVFVDGSYQAPNTPGDTDGDYNVTGYNSISFNVAPANGTNNIIVRIVEGGENYQAEKVIYTVGTAEDVYTGGSVEYEVPFQITQQRVDTYHNGLLLREAEFFDTFTETVGTSDTILTDSSKNYTENALIGHFVFVIDSTTLNEYEVRVIVDNDATTITLDSALPNTFPQGDLAEIYTPFDYFVNEKTEIIRFTSNTYGGPVVSVNDTVDIRDQAAIVSSYATMHKGTGGFPEFPTFGFEFYRDDLDAWFKYTGDEQGNPGEWVQI